MLSSKSIVKRTRRGVTREILHLFWLHLASKRSSV